MVMYENRAIKARECSPSWGSPAHFSEKQPSSWRHNSPYSPQLDLPHPSQQVGQTATISAEEIVLLGHLAHGNGAAFWKLWESYRSDLYVICLLQLDGNPAEAEDALSRAMLKAWRKLPAHAAQIKNLRAWLSRLTYNLCMDIHRERRPTCGLECLDNVQQTECNPTSQAVSPEVSSICRELSVCLHHAIGRLPLRLREPFMLRFFHEVAYPEIADHLALSPGNVRKRIQQARLILRKQLRHHVAATSGSGSGVLKRHG